MNNRKKLIIGGVIITIAVAVLGYAVFMGSGTYYYEVGELLDEGPLMIDKVTKVNGEIADFTTDDFIFHFTLLDATGRSASLPVVYRGQLPNAFDVGRLAVVEGKLDAAGIFQAINIMTKCTSKD